MRLIGMLDSPYVRRVAVSLNAMGLPFVHEPLSVFRDFTVFSAINPVVKAPTLVTDEGVTLLDSALILDYLERLVPAERRLAPQGLADFVRSQRIIGLALAANEKSVQLVYESKRPDERRYEPWVERVSGQLVAAYRLLEAEIAAAGDGFLFGARPLQADITAAVAWRFTRSVAPDRLDAAEFPALAEFSARAERLPEFAAADFD
ncbi:glutathione S-transferase [Methylosinus sp. H3A]|uniref:glutathione S-transferase family protein n=1 Tax=Methylosinus sp. H3A TaxID=2785786 RepID=UPI0018C27269|nr:glutathione S-transferase [Methylosinus sp. H3A]MBG0808724.1 glutathione S-transferase [Methylosinus sp. H3A]